MCDLLATGSGHLAGGVAATQELADTIESLNTFGATANNIMALFRNTSARDEDERMNNDNNCG